MEPGLSSDEIDASTNRIVRWEILKGLPGEGPVPTYFHLGHPTPWSEGLAVRFWNSDGTEWVGNFQTGPSRRTEIIDWPEATSVAVNAAGCFYLVNAGDPNDYCVLGPKSLVGDTTFNEDRTKLFVSDDYGIYAYGRDGRPLWKSKGLGGVIVSIGDCMGGVLPVDVEQEMGERLVTVRLSEDDGGYLGTYYGDFTIFLKRGKRLPTMPSSSRMSLPESLPSIIRCMVAGFAPSPRIQHATTYSSGWTMAHLPKYISLLRRLHRNAPDGRAIIRSRPWRIG
jgi:hypothetical protein